MLATWAWESSLPSTMTTVRALCSSNLSSGEGLIFSEGATGAEKVSFTCSLCHLYFVKEFLRFGRKISAKIG